MGKCNLASFFSSISIMAKFNIINFPYDSLRPSLILATMLKLPSLVFSHDAKAS